jgi:class 3 adenylate cyclase
VDAPLVGRQAERRLLRHLLDEARAGRPAVVVVSGMPGVGKTALLGWLAGQARQAPDGLVLRTSGDARSLPFAALARLGARLPELGDPPSWAGAPAALADALVARARRHPLLLVVDDVDELEPASAGALEEVVVGLDDAAAGGLHLLVALAVGPAVEPGGLAHRAVRLGAGRRLALGGLDEHDVFEMLAAAGPAPPPSVVREALEVTGGLPLLVEAEADRLARHRDAGPGGRWASAAPAPPGDVRVDTIADALRARLDAFGGVAGPGAPDGAGGARSLLASAALLAQPWALDTLATAAGRPAREVSEVVDAAVRARVVERDPGGVRFAHPLLRAELAAELGPAGRASLHAAFAERLRPADGADDLAVLRHADHVVRAHAEGSTAGPSADEVAAMERAGDVALRWGAWHEASRFLSAALQLAPAPSDSAQRYLAAGTAAWLDHDLSLVEQHLGAAIEAANPGDPAVELRAATQLVRARVGEGQLRLGTRPNVAELEAALAHAEGATGVGVELRVEGQAVLADAIFASGEADEALGLVDGARRLAAAAGPGTEARLAPARARLDMAEGLHRLALLQVGAARACFTEGVAHARAAGDPLAVVTLESRQAMAELLEGRVDEARHRLAAIEGEAFGRRFWGEAGFAAALAAVVGTLAGDASARPTAERAERLYRRSGHAYTAVVLAAPAAALAARRDGVGRLPDRPGRSGPAERLGAPTEDRARDVALRPSTAVAALCAAEAGDLDALRARLSAARWRHGLAGPPTLANLPIVAALVEAGDLLGTPALAVGARTALERAAETGVAVVTGWPATVDRLLAVAARHAGDPAAARLHAGRALTLAERCDLPAERAKVLVELARQQGGRGVVDRLAEAARAFDGLGMLGWARRCEVVAEELGVSAGVRPSRVVDDRTILTEDVVGSTAANARLGDALYLESLRAHDRLVRARLAEFGGEEIKHTGDGLNAIFRDATAAARCAVGVLDDVARWQRADADLALGVRCGLARGSLIPASGDYFGLVQSEAARLCALASPGEAWASAAVTDGLAADVVAHHAGRHRLRGMEGERDVFVLARTVPQPE